MTTDAPDIEACAQRCSAVVADGRRVVLRASPSEGSSFAGWDAPGCGDDLICALTLGGPTSIEARFRRGPEPTRRHELEVIVDGEGSVSSQPTGIAACRQRCSATFADGRTVVLTAKASEGFTFTGWRHPACDRDTTCRLSLDRPLRVQAGFRRDSRGPVKTAIRITDVISDVGDCCSTVQKMTVSGVLENAPRGSEVRLVYRSPKPKQAPTEIVTTTGSGGRFDAPFNPSGQTGTWRFVAFYDGTSAYAPSTSAEISREVESPVPP